MEGGELDLLLHLAWGAGPWIQLLFLHPIVELFFLEIARELV